MIDELDLDAEPAPPRHHTPETWEHARPVSVNGYHAAPASTHAAATTRTLPHSPEAEEHLLSCCLIDDGETARTVIEAGIEPESFFDPRNHLIFDAIRSIVERRIPLDVAVVAEELKSSKLIDQAGGYAYLSQVSAKSPTTAQAAYFVSKVREQAVLREFIRSATGAVEDAYAFTGDIEAFLASASSKIRSIEENGRADDSATILARRFDSSRLIAKPAPIFSVAGTPICTCGNISTIYAAPKDGKSTTIAAMIAATLTHPASGRDTFGFEGPNYENKAVIHFDTEQSPYDWQQLVQSILRRAGVTQEPKWLMSFTIAGMEPAKAERFVHATLRLARKLHGGIHSVFVDGVADLVSSPNNEEESNALVARLHGAAIDYNTAIIGILHLNPAAKDKTDKGRGHLGSQLERKCESNLTLKKDGEVTMLVAEGRQRGKPVPKDKAPAFRWSDEAGMHVSCARPKEDSPRDDRPRASIDFNDIATLIPLRSHPGMTAREILRRTSMKSPSAEAKLAESMKAWEAEGLVEIIRQQDQPIRYRKTV